MGEWKPYQVRRVTVVEEVARALREDLLDRGHDAAGESVGEEAVADHFGISRTTARATIAELVGAGYLVRGTNKPALVRRMEAQYVRDLFRVRRPIELEAVRLITGKGLSIPTAAEDACQMLEERAGDSPHRIIEANLAFHRALVEGVNNLPLVLAYDAIEGQVALALSQSGVYDSSADAVREHRRLLKILASGNWVKAKEQSLHHLKASAKDIASRLEVLQVG